MKLIVDKMPNTPSECPFHIIAGFDMDICQLTLGQFSKEPNLHKCKGIKECPYLTTLKFS
jgi:hypothetical protein